MKLLVVNLQNPNESHYRSQKGFGIYMWGRRMSNYAIFFVDKGVFIKLEFPVSEVDAVQAVVDSCFNPVTIK